MDFLAENNICGQSILRLVSRGNATIAELLRLKDFIPPIFKYDGKPELSKYGNIICDFRYFKTQDSFESEISGNSTLQDLDEELRENYLEVLTRFYLAFESIHKYVVDLNNFVSDLEEGVYIQQSLETVLLNEDGKQLMSEALYLYGVMLLVTDYYIEGPVRERLLVSYYRYSAHKASIESRVDDVCKLLRTTGFAKGGKRPAYYPEDYFRRVSIDSTYVDMILGLLRTDDIYHQIKAYPVPEHRSTALANQAAMLYVCLHFAPEILHNQTAKMREIVDKFFPDNWVIALYMGMTVDLADAWEPYKAAKLALSNTLEASNVKDYANRCAAKIEKLIPQTRQLLKEGVLTQDTLLDNVNKIMNLIRECNVTLRWILLHSYTFLVLTPESSNNKRTKQLKDWVTTEAKYSPASVFELLLNTAQFELHVRDMFRKLLEEKQNNWQHYKKECVDRMEDLADVFSGTKPLTRVERNESLQAWFRETGKHIDSLNYEDGPGSGRKMVQLIQALEEVQEFHQLESQLQVKQFLVDTRKFLHLMIRTANIREDFLINLQIVSDLSYSWLLIDSYTPHMQSAIRQDASLVGQLRATFLKLSSALDLPLMRINQAKSADLVSVSQYYSGELVAYIRQVLQIIPQTMFGLLEQIIRLQTSVIKDIPTRLEKEKMREFAQFEERFQVAKLTHDISVFTQGILAMKTTLVGIVRLDPKQLLEDGIRKELVGQVARALHSGLTFNPKAKGSELAVKLRTLKETMQGFRTSFQYIQDYVNIYGLRMFQEEASRIIAFNVEQECNTFMRIQVMEWESKYQSRTIPIPKIPPTDQQSVTFMGRLARELLRITDPKACVFVSQRNAWYDVKSQTEVASLRLLQDIHEALGSCGLAGLDRLFGFMVVHELKALSESLEKDFGKDLSSADLLNSLDQTLQPYSKVINQVQRMYSGLLSRNTKIWNSLTDSLVRIGQLQLLRRFCGLKLHSAAKDNSKQLLSALETFNRVLLEKVKNGECSSDSQFLAEIVPYLDWVGLDFPFEKVYIKVSDYEVPHIALVLCSAVVSVLPKLIYAKNLNLFMAKRSQDGLDGVCLLTGLGTLCRQWGPSCVQQVLVYLSQYWKSNIEIAFGNKDSKADLPNDVSTLLAILLYACEKWDLPALLRDEIYDHLVKYHACLT